MTHKHKASPILSMFLGLVLIRSAASGNPLLMILSAVGVVIYIVYHIVVIRSLWIETDRKVSVLLLLYALVPLSISTFLTYVQFFWDRQSEAIVNVAVACVIAMMVGGFGYMLLFTSDNKK
jgi:drug/metabolite transporter (DMT)-like permease